MNPVKGFKPKPWKVQTVLGISISLCKFQISGKGSKDQKVKILSSSGPGPGHCPSQLSNY